MVFLLSSAVKGNCSFELAGISSPLPDSSCCRRQTGRQNFLVNPFCMRTTMLPFLCHPFLSRYNHYNPETQRNNFSVFRLSLCLSATQFLCLHSSAADTWVPWNILVLKLWSLYGDEFIVRLFWHISDKTAPLPPCFEGLCFHSYGKKIVPVFVLVDLCTKYVTWHHYWYCTVPMNLSTPVTDILHKVSFIRSFQKSVKYLSIKRLVWTKRLEDA